MVTDLDKELFKTIEDIRQKRRAEQTTITLVDYGAGDPLGERSKDEMYQGVPKTTTSFELCNIGLKGEWAQKMYFFVKQHAPKTVLELGTCCGFSALYMAKAYSQATVHTIEGDRGVAAIAAKNFQEAGCDNIVQHVGRFQDVLQGLLEQLQKVDFCFIDGHHDKEATLEYWAHIKPYMNRGGVVVFDDISWSDGMREAWETLKTDTCFKRIEDLQRLGICYLH